MTTQSAQSRLDDIALSCGRLDLAHIDCVGRGAGAELAASGTASTTISPGDLTRYAFILVDQERLGQTHLVPGCRFVMASSFGGIGGLPDPLGRCDHGYIAEKFIDPRYRNTHTSVVYVEFIRAVARGWEGAQG